MPVTDLLQVDIRLLGPLAVAVGERPVAIGSPKQRIVLAMLALARRVSVDALAEELWPDTAPASAAGTIQTLVSRLRRSVEAAGGAMAIHAVAGGYVMEVDPCRIDSARFETLATAGRRARAGAQTAEAVRCFEEALALWRGPALADLADRDFARIAATRLDSARLDVAEELADCHLAAGRPDEALNVVEPLMAANPFRERLCGQRMLALYQLGRQADALAAAQDLRRTLADELGLIPSPAIQTLESQILRQSPELSAPPGERLVALPNGRAVPAPSLSGGTLAFLFTDIEASTKRWERDRRAMTADLARHDEMLRAAVESYGGHRFTHTGDGLGAAFPTASAALAAAISGQQALLNTPWASEQPLRVRMAIHAGPAEKRHGTYLGPTLNRTARLLDLASGGQILCSLAAANLARDDVPGDVTLVDLGEHRLADLAQPERVYQVIHPGLPSDFPALTAAGTTRHNLPSTVTRFIGRTAELDDLEALLATTRLLTITGVGGAGKTRLAVELAARVRPHFPDGVWLVELAPVQDGASVALAVLDVLGILSGALGGDATPPEERLCSHLRSRRVLVVFDNCEHLTDPVAHLVHTMLARCPDVTVVATSREVLGTAGETPWVAPALSLPPVGARRADELVGSDAVALFCDRARAAQPGFGVTDDNAAAVGEICRRLDGIPLALELAAARVRVLGAHQVAERLDDRFRLLAGGPRTATSRHRTLRATMDWSYDLLPPAEQALLRRLSVFPQSFDLDAAEAVGTQDIPGAADDVVDLLARLVDKSLVVVESGTAAVRYRLLETVRQYGLERLAEAGEDEPSRRRHRDFFLGLSEPAFYEFLSTPWILRADADQENFQAAIDWSLAHDEHDLAQRLIAPLWRYWWFTGRLGAATERLERALAGPNRRPTSARIQSLLALKQALIDGPGGDTDRAASLGAEALDLALAGDDPRAASEAHFFLGQASHLRGDVAAAREHLDTALAIAVEHRDTEYIPWCHAELGWTALGQGDVTEAKEQFERALTLEGRTGIHDVLRSHVLAALAPLTAHLGEPDRAQAMADEAVRLARRLPLRSVLVMALTRAGQAAVLSDRPGRAAEMLRELLGLLRDLGARRWVADALEAAALVLRANGAVEAAAEILAVTPLLRETLGERQSEVPGLAVRIDACRAQTRPDIGPAPPHPAPDRDMTVDEAIRLALWHLEAADRGLSRRGSRGGSAHN